MDSGGYGLYSTAEDYIRFLQTFICDESPLLKKETIDEMFKPQLPSVEWLQQNAVDPKGIVISGNIMFPQSPVNHGLGFILAYEDLPTGCKSGAAEGGGLTKCVNYFFCVYCHDGFWLTFTLVRIGGLIRRPVLRG
jgi:CubicO group peptidase (beta-lactamase class C family)